MKSTPSAARELMTPILLAGGQPLEQYSNELHRGQVTERVLSLIEKGEATKFTELLDAVRPVYRGISDGTFDRILQGLRKSGRIVWTGKGWKVP